MHLDATVSTKSLGPKDIFVVQVMCSTQNHLDVLDLAQELKGPMLPAPVDDENKPQLVLVCHLQYSSWTKANLLAFEFSCDFVHENFQPVFGIYIAS